MRPKRLGRLRKREHAVDMRHDLPLAAPFEQLDQIRPVPVRMARDEAAQQHADHGAAFEHHDVERKAWSFAGGEADHEMASLHATARNAGSAWGPPTQS